MARRFNERKGDRRIIVLIAVIGLGMMVWGWSMQAKARIALDIRDGSDVVHAARSYSDGGGYIHADTGAPNDIVFAGTTLLHKSKEGTHCSGFTFAVVMKVAQDRGLLNDRSLAQLRKFQKEWYGAVKGAKQKSLVVAMQNLRIGREIPPLQALPGDFVQFWTRDYGHSVIFLDWVKFNDGIVGFKYRSTQVPSNGIGDRIGYFTSSKYSNAAVIPEEFFVGRLNSDPIANDSVTIVRSH